MLVFRLCLELCAIWVFLNLVRSVINAKPFWGSFNALLPLFTAGHLVDMIWVFVSVSPVGIELGSGGSDQIYMRFRKCDS